MKIVTSIWLMFFIVSSASAQNIINTQNTHPATNQWIDFNKTYYKIKVVEDGIYRVDYQTLIDQGFSTDFTDAKRLSIINEGNEVPIYISDSENWSEGTYLEFYGKKLDGKFDQRLFENVEDQLHPYWSQFTDTAVYFLSYTEPGKKIIDLGNQLDNLPEKETYFKHTAVLHFHNSHFNGEPDTYIQFLPLESYPGESKKLLSHFASYGVGEGWIGNLFASNNQISDNYVSTSIHTPAVFDKGDSAHLTMKVVGLSRDTSDLFNHYLQVSLNNKLIVEDLYKDYAIQKYTVDLTLNQLSSPETYIECKAIHPELIDRQAMSYVDIEYPRSYDFDGINHFSFTINHKDEGNYLEFENLNEEETYFLYDLTHLIKIRLKYNSEKQIHQAYLPARSSEQRQLILQNENQIQIINTISSTKFIDYSDPINQGDYVIVTHPTLNKKDGAVQNYVNYRFSYEGGSYSPVVIDVENLYDQYSYGIRKHPLAIKYFLNEAIEKWNTTPTHCLLLGKGIKNSKCWYRASSWNSSTDNWNKNLVPSFGDSPSDQYFGSVGFNPLSRIAIGRLSAENETQIQNYLDKVIAVEQDNTSGDCSYINEAQWKHQIFHIGGGHSEEQQTRFNNRLINQANLAKNGKVTANTNFLLKSGVPDEIDGCAHLDGNGFPIPIIPQECINNFFKQGKRIVNFLGHANGLHWEVDIGEPADYTYNQKYPVMISQSNFNGDVYKSFVDDDTNSMPEEWLNAKDAGAVAYIGFDAVFELYYGADLVDALYEQIFKINADLTLGEQVNVAILSHYNEDDDITKHACNKFIFSGDPALKYPIRTKPEVEITENNVSYTVNQVNDFYYDVEIVFDFNSLNLASTDHVPYTIELISGNTITIVDEDRIKVGKSAYFKKEFTLLPNEEHKFSVHLDAANQLDEICEYNNIYKFNAGSWMMNIDDALLAGNQITAYPNPFNTETNFEITLSQAVLSQNNYLSISDLTGKKVHQIKLESRITQQSLNWKGADSEGNLLPAGVYWYQLKNSDNQIISLPEKIILVR